MAFLKKLLKKSPVGDLGNNINPFNDQLKEKIKRKTIGLLDNYSKHYFREFNNVKAEWTKANKTFTNDDIDKEAHNRAGQEALKDTASNKVWEEVEDDVENNIRKESDNDIVIKASKKTAEKTIDVMVSKILDKGFSKMKEKKTSQK